MSESNWVDSHMHRFDCNTHVGGAWRTDKLPSLERQQQQQRKKHVFVVRRKSRRPEHCADYAHQYIFVNASNVPVAGRVERSASLPMCATVCECVPGFRSVDARSKTKRAPARGGERRIIAGISEEIWPIMRECECGVRTHRKWRRWNFYASTM